MGRIEADIALKSWVFGFRSCSGQGQFTLVQISSLFIILYFYMLLIIVLTSSTAMVIMTRTDRMLSLIQRCVVG